MRVVGGYYLAADVPCSDSRDLLRFLLRAAGLFATAPAQLALQAGLRHVPAVAASLLVLTEASESSR